MDLYTPKTLGEIMAMTGHVSHWIRRVSADVRAKSRKDLKSQLDVVGLRLEMVYWPAQPWRFGLTWSHRLIAISRQPVLVKQFWHDTVGNYWGVTATGQLVEQRADGLRGNDNQKVTRRFWAPGRRHLLGAWQVRFYDSLSPEEKVTISINLEKLTQWANH